MSALLQKVLDEVARLPEPEQERLAGAFLAELERARTKSPEHPVPFVVRSKNLGVRPGVTLDHLDAVAWGDAHLLGYETDEEA